MARAFHAHVMSHPNVSPHFAAVELGLLKAVPPAYRKDAHHWLILHGRYVCKARKPECGRCVIADFCEYPDKNCPDKSAGA